MVSGGYNHYLENNFKRSQEKSAKEVLEREKSLYSLSSESKINQILSPSERKRIMKQYNITEQDILDANVLKSEERRKIIKKRLKKDNMPKYGFAAGRIIRYSAAFSSALLGVAISYKNAKRREVDDQDLTREGKDIFNDTEITIINYNSGSIR